MSRNLFFSKYIPVNAEWSVENKYDNFETVEEALVRRDRLVRTLRRGGDEYVALAGLLAECDDENPCGSASCPRCIRDLRRWVVGAAMKTFQGSVKRAVACTIVPADLWWDRGHCDVSDVDRAAERLRTQLSRSLDRQCCAAVGGFDMSLTVPLNKNEMPRWSGHFEIILFGANEVAVSGAIRRHYRCSEDSPRPVKLRKIYEPIGALSYCVKPFIQRRCRYVKEAGETRRLRTRKVRLKSDELREATFFLDQLGIQRRIFLWNCRRHGTRIDKI